jgi:V-type H+-transporting ATPase subunit H
MPSPCPRDRFLVRSTFEEYAAEVRSGELKWSPVHRSEAFWRDHAMRLNDNDHEMLRTLIATLEKNASPTAQAVALHDLGEYCRAYPRGRSYVSGLGRPWHLVCSR